MTLITHKHQTRHYKRYVYITREFGIAYTRNMTIKVSRIPQNYTKKLFEFDTYLQV